MATLDRMSKMWSMKTFYSIASALLAGAIALIVFSRASAYEYTGFYLVDPTVTYSCGSPAMAAAVAEWAAVSGLVDGGCDDMNPDIYLRNRPIAPNLAANSTMYAYHPSGPLGFCLIEVQTGFEERYALLRHEVGHCLGLRHSESELMKADFDSFGDAQIGDDDLLGIMSIYGPPEQHRLSLTMVGR
jgi:hypothetical protein